MPPLDVSQKLPSTVLVYKFISSLVFGIIASVIIWIFTSPTSSGIAYAWVRYFIPVILIWGIVYAILWWNIFRYTISQGSITITQGVLFRQTKEVNFNDIQSIDSAFGPILAIFGLRQVRGFTASPGQLIITSNRNGTTTQQRPDVNLILDRQTSDELVNLVKNGHIQKVENVSPVQPPQPSI